MTRMCVRTVIGGVAAVVFATTAAAQKTTTEYANGTTRPKSVALLPVKATVHRTRVVETEALLENSVGLGVRFSAELGSAMVEKGYQVVVVDMDRLDADAQLHEAVVEATRGFDDAVKKCKPKNIAKHKCSAGDAARIAAEYLHVDALIFSRLGVTIVPAGKFVISLLARVPDPGGAGSVVYVVDGNTGEFEARFQAGVAMGPGEKTDDELRGSVTKVSERIMSRMPSSDPAARIEPARDDDEAIDEAEQLLKK